MRGNTVPEMRILIYYPFTLDIRYYTYLGIFSSVSKIINQISYFF